jgi:glycosyltransferase involved in cell wall biosynthesis
MIVDFERLISVTPLVSIIMPIYKTEIYLPDAIESVLLQSYPNWELLLLNDESPGGAYEVATRFNDPRISYFEHSNSGPAATRNRGMKECKGDYIAFLDSDDVWNPLKLEKQIEVFKRCPDIGVVYSQRETINEYGVLTSGYKPELFKGKILNKLWIDNFVCMSSAVISRNVINEIGYFDEMLRMSEDYDYWLRVSTRFNFDFVDEPLVKYRIHNSQVSNQTDLRLSVVTEITKRFEDLYGDQLSPMVRRIAKSYALSTKAARNINKQSIYKILKYYIESLYWYPLHAPSWKGIVKALFPQLISYYQKIKQNR